MLSAFVHEDEGGECFPRPPSVRAGEQHQTKAATLGRCSLKGTRNLLRVSEEVRLQEKARGAMSPSLLLPAVQTVTAEASSEMTMGSHKARVCYEVNSVPRMVSRSPSGDKAH